MNADREPGPAQEGNAIDLSENQRQGSGVTQRSLEGLLELDNETVQVTDKAHAHASLNGRARLSHNLDAPLPELLDLTINVVEDQGDLLDCHGEPSEAGSRRPERASTLDQLQDVAVSDQERVSWPSVQGDHGQPNKPEGLFIPAQGFFKVRHHQRDLARTNLLGGCGSER